MSVINHEKLAGRYDFLRKMPAAPVEGLAGAALGGLAGAGVGQASGDVDPGTGALVGAVLGTGAGLGLGRHLRSSGLQAAHRAAQDATIGEAIPYMTRAGRQAKDEAGTYAQLAQRKAKGFSGNEPSGVINALGDLQMDSASRLRGAESAHRGYNRANQAMRATPTEDVLDGWTGPFGMNRADNTEALGDRVRRQFYSDAASEGLNEYNQHPFAGLEQWRNARG